MIEVRLPENHSFGAVSETTWATDISRTPRGREQRNKLLSRPRRRFEIDYQNREQPLHDQVLAFHLMAGGAFECFRYKDWRDYSATNQPLGTGTGALTTFQLKRTYSDVPLGGTAHVRVIDKPVQGTVKIYKAGVLQTETAHYSVNYTTGLVTFVSAPSLGQAITADFEFDVRARFEDDTLESEITAAGVYRVGVVRLVEVFDD